MDKKKVIAIIVAIVILLLIVGLILFLGNKKYTVQFDTKCEIEVESQIVKKGDTAEEPKAPTREGYKFLGWYVSEQSNEKFDFRTKITSDLTLIAKWEELEENKIEKLTIESEKNEITVGEEITLSVKITPEDIKQEKLEIIWTSSDESIATVDENGKVKALKAGKVTITVKVGEFTADFELTISEAKQEEQQANTNKPTTTTGNTNTNTHTNSNTNTNVKPQPEPTPTPEPQPEPAPEPEITYTYSWEKVDASVAGQYRLFIVSSEGKKVSGTATITTKAGKTSTVSIPASGKVYVKDAITSVSNVKAN